MRMWNFGAEAVGSLCGFFATGTHEPFNIKLSTMKIASIPLLFLCFVCPVSSPAEVVRVDWEGAFDGQMGSDLRDPERRLVIVGARKETLSFVDKTSTPPSPFAGGKTALVFDSTPDNPYWVRLCFRPFDTSEAPQGEAEFLLQPVEGRAEVQVGHQSAPWDPQVNQTYYIENAAFDVGLTPGSEPMVAGRLGETDSVTTITAGETYRVTIKWDLTHSPPIARIFLNGEVLREKGKGDPLNPPLGTIAGSKGLNAFRVSLGGPEDHVGRLLVGPMAAFLGSIPDMEQAGNLSDL